MKRIFIPPAGYSPVKLGFFAAVAFAMAAGALVPTLDRDAGIPDESDLVEAHGTVARVWSHKYGVKFQFRGRVETFDYPSKARGNWQVESALVAAGSRDVSVRLNPTGRKPWGSDSMHFDVWEVRIDGKAVRTLDESRAGWRADNAFGAWLFGAFLLSGVYLSALAWRAHARRGVW